MCALALKASTQCTEEPKRAAFDTPVRPMANSPIFICGALRSGTTLLRLMIDHHPALSNPGEFDFMFDWPEDASGEPDLAGHHKRLEKSWIFANTGLQADQTLDHPALIHSFSDAYRSPDKILTINIHRNFERIPVLYPNARYVHLVRDPRDVARSCVNMGWAGNTYYGVESWIASERSFEALSKIVPAGRIHRMRYESLITQPEEELSALCAFVGVLFDPTMLRYGDSSTYQSPDPGLIEQWRRKMSPREISRLESKVGPMLAIRGYRASVTNPPAPGAVERIRLKLENRLSRLRFLTRRYGAFLTLSEILTRKLGLAALNGRAQKRMDRITIAHLK